MDWLLWGAGIGISILIGWYFGRRNRQKPDLRYALQFEEIVAPGDWLLSGGLDLVFDDKKITRVSRTHVAIWNQRGDTVSGNSVISSDPLRVSVDPTDSILQIRLVACSRPQIGVEILKSEDFPKDSMVVFDFLDAGDGAVLEILHHSSTAPRVHGTVRGATFVQVPGLKLDRTARLALRMSWFQRNWTARRTASKLLALVVIAEVAIVAGMFAVLIVLALRPPTTVQVENYVTDTLAGQRELAIAIGDAHNAENPWTYILAFGGVAFVGVMLALVPFFRRALAKRLPRRVVARELIKESLNGYAVGNRIHHPDHGIGLVETITVGSEGEVADVVVAFKRGLIRLYENEQQSVSLTRGHTG